MSKRDYYLCDCCNEKCFYDADIPDRFEQAGKIKAICKQCAETHTISIDGKAVAANIDRLDVTGRFGWGEMVKDSEGPYMLFSDHQQALAENVALYAKQVGQALERITDDFIFRLAEKDHAYQQLMEKAVRFASELQNPTGYPSQVEAYRFLQSPEVLAWKDSRTSADTGRVR